MRFLRTLKETQVLTLYNRSILFSKDAVYPVSEVKSQGEYWLCSIPEKPKLLFLKSDIEVHT